MNHRTNERANSPFTSTRAPGGEDDDYARPVRADLHCHSEASTEAGETLLLAIKCPESYSAPAEVYEQAKRRGMDFVTLTDHDVIDGALSLAAVPGRADVLIGEELTCYFPEDRCKMHVLVWGLDRRQHDDLQAVAHDIYRVAGYLEREGLAHSVAHPVYRQNDLLERWHLERLMLLFKGFECTNGAHSALHREAFEPMLDELSPARMRQLAERHLIAPHWPEPHVKARTAGSDDHGLFNIGRTYTEFPSDVRTTGDLLACLRAGRCRPGGEAGSSLKLAHNFFSVGIKYFTRNMAPARGARPDAATLLLQAMVGERVRLRKRDMFRLAVGRQVSRLAHAARHPFSRRRQPAPQRATGAALLMETLIRSFPKRLAQHPELGCALSAGQAPLGEHDAVFRFVSALNRDVTANIADSVERAIGAGQLAGMFDALGAVAAQQFLLAPYYFAFAHQNRERRDLARITGNGRKVDAVNLKVALFTDTFDEVNGVGRFVRDLAGEAGRRGRQLGVHTCSAHPKLDAPYRRNFAPLLSRPLPMYPEQTLVLPPLAEIMEWADRQQFDAVYVDTPGPMGLAGWLVARMLRVPLLGTWHTDFPAYVDALSGDHRMTVAARGYCAWFYGQLATVFCRTRQSQAHVRATMGVPDARLALAPPGVNEAAFNPRHRDTGLWRELGVTQPHRLMYCGRLSVEKNLPLLVEAFRQLCNKRSDVALVLAGDGPYRAEAERRLAGLPARFLGYQSDAQLGPLYASSDLFVFPSRTDTLGQVVVEAQACGLPVLVSDAGGPREVMDDGLTGLVIADDTPAAWADAIDTLLNDAPRRLRMARTAPQRMNRFALSRTFDAFWDELLRAVLADGSPAPTVSEEPSKPPTLATTVYPAALRTAESLAAWE